LSVLLETRQEKLLLPSSGVQAEKVSGVRQKS